MPRSSRRITALVERLANAETAFLGTEFLAPVMAGGTLAVRIAGIVNRMECHPRDFSGWGVFEAVSHGEARFVREPTLGERQSYFERLPKVRLIPTIRVQQTWFGVAASEGDSRFSIEGLVPIRLPDAMNIFETALVRFDGANFWFEEVDRRQDWKAAEYLRESLEKKLAAECLSFKGLTMEQRKAYSVQMARLEEMAAEAANQRRRRRERQYRAEVNRFESTDEVARALNAQVGHAGARFLGYTELHDAYRVSFQLNGRQFISVIGKADSTVHTAGVCLNGEDQKFDLASLVGVLREGEQKDWLYE